MSNPKYEAVNDLLQQVILSDEGGILTGWVIAFEMMSTDGKPYSGFFIGPDTTPWKAFGLIEWAKALLKHRHIDSVLEE